MSVNRPKDIFADEETQTPNSRVIKLNPIWSTIKGFTPPLSREAIETVKQYEVVQSAFIEPQFEAILKDAQDKILPRTKEGLGVRAIIVSTEKPVHLPIRGEITYNVPDIASVLERGTELPSGDILVSRQTEPYPDLNSLSHSRVFQYLVKGVGHVLNAQEPEVKQKLTPAVLIYDLSRLQQIDGYRHRFKKPEEANKTILAIYLLDIEPAK